MNKRLVIFGAWFVADFIEELAIACGWEVCGRVDPEPPEHVECLRELPPCIQCFVAIGDNEVREYVSRRLIQNNRELVSFIHPSAIISPSVDIGAGSYIGENAVVRTHAVMGQGVFLNSGAVVSHHAKIGDYVTLGPNAATSGRVEIGCGSLVGVGASVAPKCRVGNNVTVGAGSVVIREVPDDSTVVGNPARLVQRKDPKHSDKPSDWHANELW